MLGDAIKSAKYKYILTTINKLLKQRYGWQIIIIKTYRNDELKDDRLVEASITDTLSFKIYSKKTLY
jgi:ssRNA-specific RNase YbeY (16S rRNA maturation enzyme)